MNVHHGSHCRFHGFRCASAAQTRGRFDLVTITSLQYALPKTSKASAAGRIESCKDLGRQRANGNTADVMISNCVINLSADKDQVRRETLRVLKPGGRLAVSDIVLRKPLPESARASMDLWTGCVVGALLDSEHESKLRVAGFVEIGIEPARIYDRSDAEQMAAGGPATSCCGGEVEQTLNALDGAVMSAFVRARKPLA